MLYTIFIETIKLFQHFQLFQYTKIGLFRLQNTQGGTLIPGALRSSQTGPDLPISQVGHGLGTIEFGGPLKPIYRAKINNRNVEIL